MSCILHLNSVFGIFFNQSFSSLPWKELNGLLWFQTKSLKIIWAVGGLVMLDISLRRCLCIFSIPELLWALPGGIFDRQPRTMWTRRFVHSFSNVEDHTLFFPWIDLNQDTILSNFMVKVRVSTVAKTCEIPLSPGLWNY